MAKYILGRSLRKAAESSGWLRRLLWRLDFALISTMLWLFRLLPVDRASRLGRQFGRLIGPRLETNRFLLRNLQIAFPEVNSAQRKTMARDIWGNGGSVLAEYVQMDRICGERFSKHVEICVSEEIDAFRSKGVPMVLVTAHLANWEVVGAATKQMGVDITCLYSPPANPLLADRLLCERRSMGIGLLPRDVSAREMLRNLQAGTTLGVVMDRRVDAGERLPFFGHDKPTTLIPARLALKCGCQFVPVQAERLSGANFRITFHPPIQPDDPAASQLDQAIQMTRQINIMFAEWIRQAPQDWFCTKRLWDKDLQPTNPVNATLNTEFPLRRAS